MRILHTADWHVGKTLGGRSRAAEHEAVLDEISLIARERAVDLVVVAGDLFDTAAPSPESERIVYQALLALSGVAHTIVIPGNHDNERRLAAVAPLFAHTNVTAQPFLTPEVMQHTTADGATARIALLPWLSQRYVVKADQLMAADAFEHAGTYAERVKRIITSLCAGFASDSINLVVGHVTVAGAELGGGERTAQTIFDYWVDPTVFPADAHAVLLGHIHKGQRMNGPCPIHYCGSPLQLDFSDTQDTKSVLVIDAEPGKPAFVEPVELTSGRPLKTIEGTLEQLRALADVGDAYLRVRVRGTTHVGLGDEVRELFPNTIKVIVESDRDEAIVGARDEAATPRELFTTYLAEKDIEDDALVTLFDELYEEADATGHA
ncbi:MAG TPA: exonuclease SbcCD subunit D [Actinomycetota bacterium]|nr:exonuclease SbcCD subunit D [Actinomycetota bacterium]